MGKNPPPIKAPSRHSPRCTLVPNLDVFFSRPFFAFGIGVPPPPLNIGFRTHPFFFLRQFSRFRTVQTTLPRGFSLFLFSVGDPAFGVVCISTRNCVPPPQELSKPLSSFVVNDNMRIPNANPCRSSVSLFPPFSPHISSLFFFLIFSGKELIPFPFPEVCYFRLWGAFCPIVFSFSPLLGPDIFFAQIAAFPLLWRLSPCIGYPRILLFDHELLLASINVSIDVLPSGKITLSASLPGPTFIFFLRRFPPQNRASVLGFFLLTRVGILIFFHFPLRLYLSNDCVPPTLTVSHPFAYRPL